MDRTDDLASLLSERIVILDGAWGVLLQGRGLTEEDFRGDRFLDHPRDVKGDPDLLNLTQPEIIASLHDAYLEAGADITTTNTFTATSVGQADYGLSDAVYDMNVAGARLAKESAARHGDRFVAGSIGPLNVTLSMSPKVDEASFRTISFDQVYEAYAEQIRGLRDGGADLLLIETIFDTLNAKAAIAAAKDVAPEVPLMDLGDDRRPQRAHPVRPDGRGVLDSRWSTRSRFSVGVNCSLGAHRDPAATSRTLARIAPDLHGRAAIRTPACRTPSAATTSTPETTCGIAAKTFALDGLANILGGCCGTTPAAHGRMIADARSGACAPRDRSPADGRSRFTTLQRPGALPSSRPDTGFVMIGERTNITGSKKLPPADRVRRLPRRPSRSRWSRSGAGRTCWT